MYTIIILLTSFALAQAGELHDAARVCDADHMRQLLSRRPSLNETDKNGVTPLHIAIDSRQKECVWLLLKAGADGKARDRKGRTASDAAAQIADPKDRSIIVDMLWKSGQTVRQQPTGSTPPWSLEYSVMRRQTSVTAMLLALGADPNATGSGGTTPLADAALKGDLDATRVLLAHGARPNAVSKLGTQPIHDAALGDNPEVIRELVKSGANVNARTRDEALTPLHIAATMGKMKAVEALVALGADLTIKNSLGRTPLEAAERAGLDEAVVFLRRAAAAK
jgi:uncharacterized protein